MESVVANIEQQEVDTDPASAQTLLQEPATHSLTDQTDHDQPTAIPTEDISEVPESEEQSEKKPSGQFDMVSEEQAESLDGASDGDAIGGGVADEDAVEGIGNDDGAEGVADEVAVDTAQTAAVDLGLDEAVTSSSALAKPEENQEEETSAGENQGAAVETKAELLLHQEPDIASEAPAECAETPSDIEEAVDDVEFPEAVVLVGKTHWRCVTCMAYYSRATSIDQHMRVYHKVQESPPKRGRGRGSSRSAAGRSPGRTSTPGRPPSRTASLGRGAPTGRTPRKVQNDLETVPQRVGRGRQGVRGRRGRGGRGSRGGGRGGRGSRGRGGRGRSRTYFSQKLDDSDTEPEYIPTVQPKSLSERKRKTRSSVGVKSDVSDSAEPPAKVMKPDEPASPSHETDLLKSPASDAEDRAKEMLKEKYIVIVEKAGSSSYLSEGEALADDHTLPIETPSLQADTLLPPATPVLPEIHGPPETPAPPETPHPPDTFHPPETPGAVEASASVEPSAVLFPPQPDQTSFAASHEMTTADETEENQHPDESNKHIGPAGGKTPVPVTCKTCQSVFESQAELKSHLAETSKFDIVLCNECGEKFHGVHQLNMHVFNTHERLGKKFCFVCGADFPDCFELEEHLFEHTLDEPEKDMDDSDFISHVCKICGMEVEGNVSDLMNHYHTTHDQFICTTCHECFADMTAYQDHKLSHMAGSSESSEPVVFTCPVSDCFQMCEDKEALRDHISWHEDQDMGEETTVLPCSQCSAEFRNKMSLHRHLADVHNVPDIKPFICELCNEEFSRSLDLHHHNTLNHAGIKRYGCAYCSQRFAFRSSYRRHVASQHDVAATILRI